MPRPIPGNVRYGCYKKNFSVYILTSGCCNDLLCIMACFLEVERGGRNQQGAGTALGEELEHVSRFFNDAVPFELNT